MTPLDRLNPKGRGPLTKALHDPAAKLGSSTAPASVILLHDGADNCQQDPCSAIADLKAAHPRVRIDVVSVGVPEEEAETVACLPKATGGRHYRVASTAEIDQTLLEALGRSAGPPPAESAPVPKPAPAPAPAGAPRPAPAARSSHARRRRGRGRAAACSCAGSCRPGRSPWASRHRCRRCCPSART